MWWPLTAAPGDRAPIEEMRRIGAVSPATARPTRALPPAVVGRLDELVEHGIVREGAPGTYYLFQTTTGRGFSWRRFVLTIVLWLLLILLPVAFVELSRR